MKEAELKSLKGAQERETKGLNVEIEQLTVHKGQLERQMAEVNARVQEIDSEKRKEVSNI